MKYFTKDEDYPSNLLSGEILPLGTLYNYVSNTFLNGFVNYAKPIKAFVLGRYHDWDEEIEHTINVRNPPTSLEWKHVDCKSKDELYKYLVVNGSVYHVDLDDDFQDDVIILSKVEDSNVYLYFWFDRDCSDCSIGRFSTEESTKDVVSEFENHIKNLESNEFGEREIPLHYFKGWMKG